MVPSSSRYYEFGSTAGKIKYDVYKENAVLSKKRNKVKYTRIKLRVVLLMLLMFSCGMVMMYRYAVITGVNYKIDEAKRIYNNLKNENVTARVKIENTLDLSNVRDVAVEKFGMHKPLKEQIVSVSVPKADYFKSREDKTAEDISSKNILAQYFMK